jgi:hypothetical protein
MLAAGWRRFCRMVCRASLPCRRQSNPSLRIDETESAHRIKDQVSLVYVGLCDSFLTWMGFGRYLRGVRSRIPGSLVANALLCTSVVVERRVAQFDEAGIRYGATVKPGAWPGIVSQALLAQAWTTEARSSICFTDDTARNWVTTTEKERRAGESSMRTVRWRAE